MSLNLPPDRLLKTKKGNWADIQYPARVVVQARLAPRDYFEPVDPESARSCVPVGATGFSYFLDANVGRMVLRGPTMFPAISATFEINGTWSLMFVGSVMQLSETLQSRADVDRALTMCEHVLPAMLSLATGLSIFAEAVEIGIGDNLELEARSETLTLPPNSVRVIDPNARINELLAGTEMLGFAASSGRFVLACSYLQEAIYYDASYYEHNPYQHSLIVIVKCAQAIEVLFGSKRDAIREKCRSLDIGDDIIEAHIVPITIARNQLGSAHASFFVPNNREVPILREFAKRSVGTVRQLLLHIAKTDREKRSFLTGAVERDKEKEEFLVKLERSLRSPAWGVAEQKFGVPDPRLPQVPLG